MDGKRPTSQFKLFLSDHGATPPMCIVVCSAVMMMMCRYPCPKNTYPSKVLHVVCVCVCVQMQLVHTGNRHRQIICRYKQIIYFNAGSLLLLTNTQVFTVNNSLHGKGIKAYVIEYGSQL